MADYIETEKHIDKLKKSKENEIIKLPICLTDNEIKDIYNFINQKH